MVIPTQTKRIKNAGFIGLGSLMLLMGLPSASRAGSSGLEAYNHQDYEDAEKYFEEKAGKSPGDFRSQYNLGTSLYQLQRYEDASKAFEKSVEDKPEFEYGWYNLGTAYARLNRYQDAIDAFQRALQLNPNDEDAKRNLEIIKRKLAQNPKKDQSKTGGKYAKNNGPGKGGTPNATPSPTGTALAEMPTPPPARKNEKEDENAKKKVKDQGAKNKYKSKEPSDQTQQDASAGQKPGKGVGDNTQQEERQDQARQEQAKKELGLTDQQVKTLMKKLQQQEANAQAYYSPNPKRELEKQPDIWRGFPRDQQEFLRRFFGQPEKGKDGVPEDW